MNHRWILPDHVLAIPFFSRYRRLLTVWFQPRNTRWISVAERRLAQARLAEDTGEADKDNVEDTYACFLLYCTPAPSLTSQPYSRPIQGLKMAIKVASASIGGHIVRLTLMMRIPLSYYSLSWIYLSSWVSVSYNFFLREKITCTPPFSACLYSILA